MLDLIHKTYADRVTLQTLGTALRGKPEYLGRLFQAVVGVSVREYVTRVRLEQAAHLIRSGLKIEAVALGAGYRSKNQGIQPFAASSDYIEISGESEADAVERAEIFLERRFGPRHGNPKKQHNHKHPPPILAPRT